MSGFFCVIPARENSKRLPRKLLLEVFGKPVVVHTALACLKSEAKKVFVATDSRDIKRAVEDFCLSNRALSNKIEVRMVRGRNIKTGSDRVGELIRSLESEGVEIPDVVVNVQGDEPLITPDIINSVARELFADKRADISTYGFWSADEKEYRNPNRVKIVLGKDNFALYFSRAPIPFGAKRYIIHTGIYAFRTDVLKLFLILKQTENEKTERLEQLRAIDNGIRIKVVVGRRKLIPIDTIEDLRIVRSLRRPKL